MLSGREGMSPVMVGRSAAAGRLRGLVDVALATLTGNDRPTVALVAGEPGIGKTRLVSELTAHLPDGVVALTMAAQPGSIGRSGDALHSLSTAEGRPLGLEHGTDLDVAVVIDAIRERIGSRAAVLVVEDLHWIDAASALVIDRLVQEVWPGLVLVGTYRPADLTRGAPGGDLVLALERRHAVEQFRLDRLDRHDVGVLMTAIGGTPPSSAVVEAVHRRSGGIPFVVEELMRCCSPTSPDDVFTAQLPWSLDEAVREQIAGLDTVRRTAIDALAVYGRPMPFSSLLAVTDLDETDLVGALRGLVAADVVVEAGDDLFWFVHALVADAVERQLLGRERRRLHARCLDAVAAEPARDPSALVRHALGAGRFDEVAGIAREGAARYLAEGSSFQALRLAAQALAEEPDDLELLRIATDAAWRMEFLDEALVTARRWVGLAVDDGDRIDALRFLARLGVELDQPSVATDAVTELEDVAASMVDPVLIGVAAAAVAQIHMIACDSEPAVEWADRALEAARAAGDELTAAHALVERASAAISLRAPGTPPLDGMLEALAAARSVDDPVLISRAINNCLELVPIRSDLARELRAELTVTAARSGLDKLGADARAWWDAEWARSVGDLEMFRRTQAMAAQWGVRGRRRALVARGDALLALEEGRVADARQVIDRVLATTATPDIVGLLRSLLLSLSVAEHDRTAARTTFEAVLSDRPPYDASWALDEVLLLVEGALAAGIGPDHVRSGLVEQWLRDHPSVDDLARHADGLLLAASGRHDEAVVALSAVLDAPSDRLSAASRAMLGTTLASELLACGDRSAATTRIRQVIDVDLARWPGVRRDRAEALARRLEGSVSRADGALTTRELEIAGLLVDGLTNGGLAERLYISPKTAAVHVSNILAKLGLSSRAEIAAWAVRNGLDHTESPEAVMGAPRR